MKSILQYILLILSWLLVTSYIIYEWIQFSSITSFWLWLILIIISVIPLASRLKIGTWFDFKKKVNELDIEITSVKEDVAKVTNLIGTIQNVQSPQQFNIGSLSLESEESVKAFMSHFPSYTKIKSKAISFKQVGDQDYIVIEGINLSDAYKFNFLQSIDEIITSIKPLLYILHNIMVKIDGLSTTDECLFKKDILIIIQEIQNSKLSKIMAKDIAEKTLETLNVINNLINLRKNIIENNAEVPSDSKTKASIHQAMYGVGLLNGYVSGIVEVFLTSDAFFRNGKFLKYIPH